jgi:prepilin-type N-terminal cleavage/methylation domain-containing protein
MKKIFNKNIWQNSGFTIMEMTIVIFIITVGLTGVLSLATQNVQVQTIDKGTVIASQLAQEGLELVRNKRDTNWIQTANPAYWNVSTSSASRLDIIQLAKSKQYTVDAVTGSIGSAPTGITDAGAKLYLNAAKFYTHQVTATSTPFSRLITVGNESGASTTVICLVQWKTGNNTYNYSAQTVLYNWK